MKSNILKKEIHRDHYPKYDCRWSADNYDADIWWLMWRKDYEVSRWINNDYPQFSGRHLYKDEREIYNKKIDQIDFELLDIGNG